MIPVKIRNWLITEDGIKWEGQVEYSISKSTLLDLRPEQEPKIYDWLIHMAIKTWTTKADIYALNTAFIYALEHFGYKLDTASWIATIIEQEKEIAKKPE